MTRDELLVLERCVTQLTKAQDRIDRMLLQRKRVKAIAQPEVPAPDDPAHGPRPGMPDELGAILAASRGLREQIDRTFATYPPMFSDPPTNLYDETGDEDEDL
jgi:hypothetical protein